MEPRRWDVSHKSSHRFGGMDMQHGIDRSRTVLAIHPSLKMSPAGNVAETRSMEPDALGAVNWLSGDAGISVSELQQSEGRQRTCGGDGSSRDNRQ